MDSLDDLWVIILDDLKAKVLMDVFPMDSPVVSVVHETHVTIPASPGLDTIKFHSEIRWKHVQLMDHDRLDSE